MTSRHYLFISFLLQGKSARQAALLAGFAPSVAARNVENMLGSARFQTELSTHFHRVENMRSQLQQAANLCSEAISNPSLTMKERLMATAQLGKLMAQIHKLPVYIAPSVLSNNPHNYLPEPDEVLPTEDELQADADAEQAKAQAKLQREKTRMEKAAKDKGDTTLQPVRIEGFDDTATATVEWPEKEYLPVQSGRLLSSPPAAGAEH